MVRSTCIKEETVRENHPGTHSSQELNLSPNYYIPVILQVDSVLPHHLLPVPLELSFLEQVPTTPLSAFSALGDSSTPGLARMPAFPVVQRPPNRRKARTHASAEDLAKHSRYVLWQWDLRTEDIPRTVLVSSQAQLRCNLTGVSSGCQVTWG